MAIRVLLSLSLALIALAAAACGGSDEAGDGIRVVATTTHIGALTREVAGDNVRLTVLLRAGADAHNFEPSPQDVVTLNRADLVFMHGIGLDDWMEGVIEGADSGEKVRVVTEGVDVWQHGEEPGDHDDGHDHDHDHDHDHEEGDPHVWHDPANVKVMVQNIATALAEADPDNAATYEANAARYASRLDEVDAEIRALFADIPAENRKVVTNHESLGYFIRAYDLEFVGAVIPGGGGGSQPSAQDLAALNDLIRDEGVRAILAEAEIDPRVAEQLARDTGVQVVTGLYADSLGEEGSGADTVDGMLLSNARKIAEALNEP